MVGRSAKPRTRRGMGVVELENWEREEEIGRKVIFEAQMGVLSGLFGSVRRAQKGIFLGCFVNERSVEEREKRGYDFEDKRERWCCSF